MNILYLLQMTQFEKDINFEHGKTQRGLLYFCV